MKKFGIICFTILLYFVNCAQLMAAEITDVSESHWAYPEINALVEAGLMSTNSRNEFKPNDTITRADFVALLLRVCDFKNSPISQNPYFKDLTNTTRNLEEILTSQQLRIIYGYPDKTFRPEIPTKRAEATSAVAHVINSNYRDLEILNDYIDENQIPDWAVDSYVQVSASDLNVNYPNPKMLEPNKNITRAQAAMMSVKVYSYLKKSTVVSEEQPRVAEQKQKEEKKIQEVFVKNETLDLYRNAPRNIVEIYNTKVVIGAGNVLIGSFTNEFTSRKANVGDTVNLVAKKDVATSEGRQLYPAGTVFSGKVQKVKLSTWRDKKDKVLLVFDKATPPRADSHNMAAVAYTKNNKVVLTKGRDKKEKMTVGYKRTEKELTKTQFLVNFANKVSPRIKFKNKTNDEIYILLTGDMILQYVDPSKIRKDRL